MTITRIGAALALLAGLGFALSGYLSYRQGQEEFQHWVETQAELVGTRSTHDAVRGYLYYPTVRFAPEGAQVMEAEVIFPTDRSRDKGAAMVLYDRRDPQRVALDYSVWQRRDTGENGMIGGGIVAGFGLLGLLFGGRRQD